MYNELLEKDIIPEIEQESPEVLTTNELSLVDEKLDENVQEFNRKIEASEDVAERKELRTARKEPKQLSKQFRDFASRKLKYENDMKIFGERNSYSKRILTRRSCE
jgi:hypothetical protein